MKENSLNNVREGELVSVNGAWYRMTNGQLVREQSQELAKRFDPTHDGPLLQPNL